MGLSLKNEWNMSIVCNPKQPLTFMLSSLEKSMQFARPHCLEDLETTRNKKRIRHSPIDMTESQQIGLLVTIAPVTQELYA